MKWTGGSSSRGTGTIKGSSQPTYVSSIELLEATTSQEASSSTRYPPEVSWLSTTLTQRRRSFVPTGEQGPEGRHGTSQPFHAWGDEEMRSCVPVLLLLKPEADSTSQKNVGGTSGSCP